MRKNGVDTARTQWSPTTLTSCPGRTSRSWSWRPSSKTPIPDAAIHRRHAVQKEADALAGIPRRVVDMVTDMTISSRLKTARRSSSHGGHDRRGRSAFAQVDCRFVGRAESRRRAQAGRRPAVDYTGIPITDEARQRALATRRRAVDDRASQPVGDYPSPVRSAKISNDTIRSTVRRSPGDRRLGGPRR